MVQAFKRTGQLFATRLIGEIQYIDTGCAVSYAKVLVLNGLYYYINTFGARSELFCVVFQIVFSVTFFHLSIDKILWTSHQM